MSLFQKIKDHFNKKNQNAYFEGFKRTNDKFGTGLLKLLKLNSGIDDIFYKELMQVLIESDIGIDTSQYLLNQLKKEVKQIAEDLEKDVGRELITIDKIRPDGRKLDEIRPLSSEVNLLPRAHGSGLFTRGQTQALSVCTLGSLSNLISYEYKSYKPSITSCFIISIFLYNDFIFPKSLSLDSH